MKVCYFFKLIFVTFVGRTRTSITTDSPGPGAYTSDGMAGKGPAYSLSGRPDSKIDSDSRTLNVTLNFLY
jgi:hypothetical protein